MAITLENSRLGAWPSMAVASVHRWVQGLFGHADFSPEESLAATKHIDPRLMPRAPMSNADIDVHLLNELGKLGLKRGKLITQASHPELMQVWQEMSARAGLARPPQLILVENKAVNALTVSPEEVVVTTGLFKMLNLRETAAVLGHELAHESSNHQKPRLAAKAGFGLAGIVGGHFLGRAAGVHRWKWTQGSVLLRGLSELVFWSIGALVGSAVANQVAVRSTELDADAKGIAVSGDPEGMISALNKIQIAHVNGSVIDWIEHVRGGYPSISTRIDHLKTLASSLPQQQLPAVSVIETPEPKTNSQPRAQVSAIAANVRLDAAPPEPGIAIH